MGETMMCRYGARFALRLATAVSAFACSATAFAASLPQVQLSDGNSVPACATPGRLTAFLEQRNGALPEKFSTIAADYMRIGEQLHIRWDIAFFQMLLETGNLKFTGDVSADQNNFAGLGATGRKEHGESFPDVATGVQAHLEHLLLYAGTPVDNPVAERTRKVREWGVLDSWQKSVKGPMTYTMLAKKWAPSSRNYSRDIANVADAFYSGACHGADPKPEMMALVHPETAAPSKTAAADDGQARNSVSGSELAKRAVAEARASGSFVRSSLGASSLTAEEAAATAQPVTAEASDKPAFKIINGQQEEAAETPAETAAAQAALEQAANEQRTKAAPKQKVLTAALGAGTKNAVQPAKCRVWTASYGGAHAMIIKASTDDTVNYTVLDVNEQTAKREAEAYIAAYAKGGQTVGEFPNQTQALDKAFELCPEG
ncbi:MAG: glucosaminidase domain-containing protein [Hyphomicrobiaceae bacterium]